MTEPAMFLEPEELRVLTGRKLKSKQIQWLRGEGIPFRVNALGHPVVTRVTVESRKPEPAQRPSWSPRALGAL